MDQDRGSKTIFVISVLKTFTPSGNFLNAYLFGKTIKFRFLNNNLYGLKEL